MTSRRDTVSRPVTSRDVAALAGVSQSTVSYVLSGKRFVSPDTEARVLDAMESLGYRPHASARALRSQRSRVIGLVVPYHELTDTTTQYRYVVTIGAACRQRGYELLVTSSEEGFEGMQRLISSAQCDGLVIMDILEDDPRVDGAERARIPSVFIGLPPAPTPSQTRPDDAHDTRSATSSQVDAVDTSFEAIAQGCIDELRTRGHRHVIVLSAAHSHIRSMGFAHRFRQTLDEYALLHEMTVEHLSTQRGYLPIEQHLRSALGSSPAHDPDHLAVVVGPSLCADDAANALLHLGRLPGQDCSLIAASAPPDELHTPVDYAYFDPNVRTVVSQAMALLVNRLEGASQRSQNSQPSHPAQRLLVDPLFHRGTSLLPCRQPADG